MTEPLARLPSWRRNGLVGLSRRPGGWFSIGTYLPLLLHPLPALQSITSVEFMFLSSLPWPIMAANFTPGTGVRTSYPRARSGGGKRQSVGNKKAPSRLRDKGLSFSIYKPLRALGWKLSEKVETDSKSGALSS